LRKPSIALLSWWNEAYVGEFKALGDMLCDFGLHSHQLDSVPDLSALAQFELAWIPKSGGSRRQKHNQKFNRNSLQEQLIKCLLLSLIVHLAMILNLLLDPWPHEADEILRSFPADLFIFNEGFSWPPSSPDFLDTYSGKKGFAKAAIKRGASWALTIDIEIGSHLRSSRALVLSLLQRGVFSHFSFAPICASFSKAITTLVRSKAYPLGVPGLSSDMRRKLPEGDRHLGRVCTMVSCCIALGVHYWFENPASSHMWYQKCVVELHNDAARHFFQLVLADHVHIFLPGRAKGQSKMLDENC